MRKHRSFTYKEEQFNTMDREKLMETLFLPTIDQDKLRYSLRKRGIQLSIRRMRELTTHLKMKNLEEIPDLAYEILDTIRNLREAMPTFRQSEIVAVVLNYLDRLAKGEEKDQAIQQAFSDHINDFETSMDRLNF